MALLFREIIPKLVLLHLKGKLDPVVGRQGQIERVIQILGRRTKNNPCLIGEPGVGKTAIAEGLALRIASGDVPETIAGKNVSISLFNGSVERYVDYRIQMLFAVWKLLFSSHRLQLFVKFKSHIWPQC